MNAKQRFGETGPSVWTHRFEMLHEGPASLNPVPPSPIALPKPLEVGEHRAALPWIQVAPDTPYFVTDEGDTWTPIGQNDAISWPELRGLYRRKDPATAEAYIRNLAEHGVTVVRLMLEYSQFVRFHFEKPMGRFRPEMIRLWDDLFALCEKYGLRVLLTPYDTFWMWIRWKKHPYNQASGGACSDRRRILLCPDTRQAIKARLAFAVERWGGSGALFAWDLWNEIHPSYAQDSAACFTDFIADLSTFVRDLEIKLYGRVHPQTVSVFGPHMVLDKHIPESIFRHPLLDFASTHFYEEGTIDHPKNTVDAALSVGKLVREALAELRDDRPFFDSEHGPIHTFKDHHRTLPEPFDDEYFRHIQWAHFAAGGAGGGMRWPNRKPHSLTPGMRVAQRNLARFLPFIDFQRLKRQNWNDEIRLSNAAVRAVGCGDAEQAIVWLIRVNRKDRHRMLRRDVPPVAVNIHLPSLGAGQYHVTAWDTLHGQIAADILVSSEGPSGLRFRVPPFAADVALAIRRC